MKKFSIIKSVSFIMLAFALTLSLFCFTGCGNTTTGTQEENDPERNQFIDGIGGVSETFCGAVSEESYPTSTDAAKAYIEVEIVGEKDAEILSTQSKGELSSQEIDALKIPEELSNGINSVELIEVEFEIIEDSYLDSNVNKFINLSDKATLNKSRKVDVYVIKYTVDWKYFTPMPITGETISKSYYDSVFNYEKFKNCTFENESSISLNMSMSGDGMSESYVITMNTKQTIKYAGNKVFLEQTIISTDSSTGTNQNETVRAYIEEDEFGYLTCYVQTNDDDWFEGNLTTIGFYTLEQLTPFYNQYLDYSYFKKTDFGFKLSEENAMAYLSQALDAAVGSMLDLSGMDINMYAEYYVSDGTLSGMRMNADIGMNVNEGGYKVVVDESVTGIARCTNYGTTVVEKPFTE